MKRLAVTAASVAITAAMLFTATPAEAAEPDPTTTSPSTGTIHHRFELHHLDRGPHGLQYSVRKAHPPGH